MDQVNHPTHYNQYEIETIEMIIRIWGKQRAAEWCEITAFKYRIKNNGILIKRRS